MGRTKLGDAISEGYLKATRTVICPYCWQTRSVENLHQTKPRVKCKPCFENRGKKK